MALTLVVEDGSGLSNSNSYATAAEADAYFLSRLHNTVWDAATNAQKEAALVWATRLLDTLVSWKGEPTNDDDQALRFPREGLYTRDGDEIADDSIPQWLKDAVAEFAADLISSDRTGDPDSRGITDLQVGPIRLNFDKADTTMVIPDAVWSIISFWGEKYDSIVRLKRY